MIACNIQKTAKDSNQEYSETAFLKACKTQPHELARRKPYSAAVR
jgi:hypothetical protein